MEHEIIRDHSTKRSRGFGFVIFDSEEAVDDLLSKGNMIDFAGSQVSMVKGYNRIFFMKKLSMCQLRHFSCYMLCHLSPGKMFIIINVGLMCLICSKLVEIFLSLLHMYF